MLHGWRKVMQLYLGIHALIPSWEVTILPHSGYDLHAYVIMRPLIGRIVYTWQTGHYKCMQILIHAHTVL